MFGRYENQNIPEIHRARDKLGMWQKGEAGKLDSYFTSPYSICNLVFLYEFIFWVPVLHSERKVLSSIEVSCLSLGFAFMFRGTYLYTASFQGPSYSSMSLGLCQPALSCVVLCFGPSILFLSRDNLLSEESLYLSPPLLLSGFWDKLEYHSLDTLSEASSASSDVLVNVY